MLIGGVLIGPHVLGLAETSNIQLLANIGLGFLFLLALATSWIRNCCVRGAECSL